MHAYHLPVLFLYLLYYRLTGGYGLFMIHIETGTIFGMSHLKGYTMHNVAHNEKIVYTIDGMTGCVSISGYSQIGRAHV